MAPTTPTNGTPANVTPANATPASVTPANVTPANPAASDVVAGEAVGADAGHGGAVPETLLGLDSYAWVGLAFLAFVLLLWRIGAFRMIGSSLDAQAEKVKADLAEAAQLKAEAEAMEARAASLSLIHI